MTKKKGNKKSMVAAVFFAVAAIVALAAVGAQNDSTGNKLVFVLDYGNNNKSAFRVPVSGEKKVWSLLQQATMIKNVDLRADRNFVPVKIDGFPNGKDGKKWELYVNGVRQKKSPAETVVKGDDKVVFRFE